MRRRLCFEVHSDEFVDVLETASIRRALSSAGVKCVIEPLVGRGIRIDRLWLQMAKL